MVVERLRAAAEASRAADTEVVPAARSALQAVEVGYREGKFGFIDVIGAQRALFEATTLLLDSLEEYALARTDLERLVGGSIADQPAPVHNNSGEQR
jgi:cobalt-zinc-cadmium efflux system outer membrane protein